MLLIKKKNNNPLLRFVAYAIVLITLFISLIFPLVIRFVGIFAIPTATCAIQTADSNGLLSNPIPESHRYWQGVTKLEVDFPFPSILLSIFISITGISNEWLIFIPITGLANIACFVLAKRVLCGQNSLKGYGLLLSALFYAFTTFNSLSTNYVGRATLGVTFLTYFLLCYILFLYNHLSGHRECTRAWFVMLSLFTLATGYTYYTSTLAIVAITSLTIVVLSIIALLSEKPIHPLGLTLTVIAMCLLIWNPFINTMEGKLDLNSFITNIVQYMTSMLGIEAGQSGSMPLQWKLIDIDFPTRVIGGWLIDAIKLSSIVAVVLALFRYSPKKFKTETPKIVWLFSLVVLLSGLSELTYLFLVPLGAIRFLSTYGLIVLFFGLNNFIEKRDRSKHGNFWKKALLLLLVIIVSLGCLGSLRAAWDYSPVKPFAYYDVKPLTDFLVSYSSCENPVTITGDIDYIGNIFFITFSQGNFSSIIPEPLGKDALTLSTSLLASEIGNNSTPFIVSMNSRNIRYLLIINGTKSTWGDPWSYGVTLRNTYLLKTLFSLVYNDGRSQFFEVT